MCLSMEVKWTKTGFFSACKTAWVSRDDLVFITDDRREHWINCVVRAWRERWYSCQSSSHFLLWCHSCLKWRFDENDLRFLPMFLWHSWGSCSLFPSSRFFFSDEVRFFIIFLSCHVCGSFLGSPHSLVRSPPSTHSRIIEDFFSVFNSSRSQVIETISGSHCHGISHDNGDDDDVKNTTVNQEPSILGKYHVIITPVFSCHEHHPSLLSFLDDRHLLCNHEFHGFLVCVCNEKCQCTRLILVLSFCVKVHLTSCSVFNWKQTRELQTNDDDTKLKEKICSESLTRAYFFHVSFKPPFMSRTKWMCSSSSSKWSSKWVRMNQT